MTIRFDIHPDNPQQRLLWQAAQLLRDGGLIAMPTDACYVLAAGLADKNAVERLRQIRGIDARHLLSLMCADLKQVSIYAQVDNAKYRFLREWTPGPYTFVLPATKETPRRLWHPSRKTIGLRVPDNPIAQGVLRALEEPVLVSSLVLPGDELPLNTAEDILERVGKRIDGVIDAGDQGFDPTTVIDVTGPTPVVERIGCGPIEGMVDE
ncbi:MAG: L-threonylcarbamoyladenylate synthase [Burkholderiaceae bacterium]